MQNLYDKVTSEFTELLEKYMNNEIDIKDVLKMQEREKLVLDHENWNNKKNELKESMFQLTKHLYEQINECDKKIRTFKLMNEEKEYEIDKDTLVSHAILLSRNKAPPAGFESSHWYLGPYPTIQMIEALNDQNYEDN